MTADCLNRVHGDMPRARDQLEATVVPWTFSYTTDGV